MGIPDTRDSQTLGIPEHVVVTLVGFSADVRASHGVSSISSNKVPGNLGVKNRASCREVQQFEGAFLGQLDSALERPRLREGRKQS